MGPVSARASPLTLEAGEGAGRARPSAARVAATKEHWIRQEDRDTTTTRADGYAIALGSAVAAALPMLLALALGVMDEAQRLGSPADRTAADSVSETAAFVAAAGAVSLPAVALVGVPLALVIERRLVHLPAWRVLAYTGAGAVAGAVSGLFWVGGPDTPAVSLLFALIGAGAATAGGAVVAWGRRMSPHAARPGGILAPVVLGVMMVLALLSSAMG